MTEEVEQQVEEHQSNSSSGPAAFSVMKEQNIEEEVTKILQEAPHARRALLENYDNLLNVADYCYNNYLQSGDRDVAAALEETKHFANQSLASVVYQINTLASSILTLLDAQANQLQHMESTINLIGQTVEMHKEKVSRREIGAFTVVRQTSRSHKLLSPPPAGTQPRPPYSRQPINYQQLDNLGHGQKVTGKQIERPGILRKHGDSTRPPKTPEPVYCPVAPPVRGSSFGRPVDPPILRVAWKTSPPCNMMGALLETPPPLTAEEDGEAFPAPPPLSTAPSIEVLAPSTPPSQPALANHNMATLETVVEDNVLLLLPPLPPPPPFLDDNTPFGALANMSQELPASPPPAPPLDRQDDTVKPRKSVSPPSCHSLSLRVCPGPTLHHRFTRSLFLPAGQSLMIPPPPPYPPPLAPPILLSSSRCARLPARLQHLDLEILGPPPSFHLDDATCFDDIIASLPPPLEDDGDE